MPRRLLVIGAGPVGIAAALSARARGFDVTVLEKGSEVAGAIRRWGPTRLFSPFAMNLPAPLAQRLPKPPSAEALLTGPEFVGSVLEPLAEELGERVLLRHAVLAVGRRGMTRGDYPGHPLRAERPFRVLAATPAGEATFEADGVLDASGTHGQPCMAGRGGLPALGERALGERVIRHLGTLHCRRAALRDRHLLVVGDGHSAANALLSLAALAREAPATRVTWAVRTPNRRPLEEVAGDPLPERARVAGEVNDLAADPPSWLTLKRRAAIEELREEGGGVRVRFSDGEPLRVDEVAAFTGYRPDLSFLSELALEISPASEGAAGIARALCSVTDCLSAPRLTPRDLASGEPGFALAGAKSHGRMRSFLLQNGHAQVETLLGSFGVP